MTIPKIQHIFGNVNTEKIVLMCTGCNEYYEYSVRQYKGDFGCNLTEFDSFMDWARGEAARHECFEAGSRVGYLPPDFFEGVAEGVAAANEGRVTSWEEVERHFLGGYGKPAEPRHEDPWGDDIMRAAINPLMQGDAPDGTPYAGDTWDEDIEDENPDEDDWDLGDDADEEPFGDNHDWAEERFGFLYFPFGFGDEVQGSATGRLHSREPEMQNPCYIIKLEGKLPDPIEIELKVEGVPQTTQIDAVFIEYDYASLEQRILEVLAEDAGIYTRDAQGHLRDEKGRCLACLRPGVHR